MATRRLAYAVMVILVSLNAVPRMLVAGKYHWFAVSVPEPERFASEMNGVRARADPPVTRVFGYPFPCYFEVGREFRTKSARELFWPSDQRLSFRERFSFAAAAGNLTVVVGIGVLLLVGARRRCTVHSGAKPDTDHAPTGF